ncbi:MAG: hypothetical protein R3264_05490 [Anaerolineae bacterium]|nr:hypothetical protein [Anaerolineae bacterium]
MLMAVALTLLSVLGHAAQFVYGRDSFSEYVRLFNLGGETNIPTWYTSICLFLCGILSGYISAIKKMAETRYALRWAGLSVLFLLLSMDAIAVIHDRTIETILLGLFNLRGFFYFPWVILGWLLTGLLTILYYPLLLALPRRVLWLFVVSAGIYITGALVLEMYSAYLMDYHVQQILLRGAVATVQETAELTGLVIFIYALLWYIGAYVNQTPHKGAK